MTKRNLVLPLLSAAVIGVTIVLTARSIVRSFDGVEFSDFDLSDDECYGEDRDECCDAAGATAARGACKRSAGGDRDTGRAGDGDSDDFFADLRRGFLIEL